MLRYLLSARSFFPNTPTYTETGLRLHNTQLQERASRGAGGGQFTSHWFTAIFEILALLSWLGFLPDHLQSMAFMSLPNPILQWHSRYLRTDIPALQVFDEIRPESLPFSIRRLLAVQHPDPGRRPGPALRHAPGPRPARDRPLRVRVWRATGAAGRSATGHRPRVRGPADDQAPGRSRPGQGGGVAGSAGPAPAHLRRLRRCRGRGSAGGGRGFPPPGGRARRAGGSPRPGLGTGARSGDPKAASDSAT